MRLHTNISPVEITGGSTPSGFQIAQTLTSFKTLSSGLYTNKIRAIIRELCCNAWDAMVAAGTPNTPFYLHLPTSFEPFFMVKDEGTGLKYVKGGCKDCKGSGQVRAFVLDEKTDQPVAVETTCPKCRGTGNYDAVIELYCTYFASDKGDSDLFIGALGLGSKSPFCYTEGFSVINSYKGVSRVYSCFIDEKGMPNTVLQTETETPMTPNGVEVSFPVKQNDVWEFENQAKYVLEFFDPVPTINVPNLYIRKKEYTYKTDRWGLRKEGGSPRAIQGFVQYDIGSIDISRLSADQQKLVKLPLDLFFPIGQLEVAASRESLSNSERTIENILTALDLVRVWLLEDAKKQLAVCKTAWEARLLIHNLSVNDRIGYLITAALKAGDFLNINPGFKLVGNDSVGQITTKDYPGIAIHEFNHSYGRSRVFANRSCLSNPNGYRKNNTKSFGESSGPVDVFFPTNKDCIFIINDVGFGTERYVHYAVQTDTLMPKLAFLITKTGKEIETSYVIRKGKALIEALGNPPAILMSQLKETYKEAFSTRTAPQIYIPRTALVFNENAYVRDNSSGRHGYVKGWKDSWDNATGKVFPDGVKYYVPVKNLEPQTGNFSCSKDLRSFIQAVRLSKKFMFTHEHKVYGIPVLKVKKLGSDWVEFTGYISNQINAVLTPWTKLQIELTRENFSSGYNKVLEEIGKQHPLDATSPLQQFCNKWESVRSYDKAAIAQLMDVLNKAQYMNLYAPEVEENTPGFKELWDDVKKVYPLLGFLTTGYYNSPDGLFNYVTQYARLIDEQNWQQAQIDLDLGPLDEVQSTTEETDYAN